MALGILLLVGSISDDDRNSPQFGGAGVKRKQIRLAMVVVV